MSLRATITIAHILPLEVQTEIESFWRMRTTGQIALNFASGKVVNHDVRNHKRGTDVFCYNCALPRQNGDVHWEIRNGKAICPNCAD